MIIIIMNNCCQHKVRVGFEVITAVSTKMVVFWVVAPCSLVEVYQRFRGPCCLHHQVDEFRVQWQPFVTTSDISSSQKARNVLTG
jgi:hypothetical protein